MVAVVIVVTVKKRSTKIDDERGNLHRERISEDTVLPYYVPLPSGRATEFYTGLRRGVLNRLVLPTPANAYRPPVRSISLAARGQLKGKRLVHLGSLLAYLDTLLSDQAP